MPSTYVVCGKCGQVNKVATGSEKVPICGSCQSNLPVHDALVVGSDSSLPKLMEKSPLPIVVDVWATWCGPCRSFAPTFEAGSQEFAGKAVFVKLDSEENQRLPSQWGIRGIPTLIVFKNGKELGRVSGALPKGQFTSWLQKVMG